MREQLMLIDKLERERQLSFEEWKGLLSRTDTETEDYLFEKARSTAKKVYGNKVFIRGLIEISNYCKNDCHYCGIRCGNRNTERYRLTEEEILSCCENGYRLGFRTFVMQGGEDGWYTDERVESIVKVIRKKYPDCAITLSLGERSKESYQRLFDAGANRYLLRHETADEEHYRKLHPSGMSMKNRMQCLRELKEIGYQTGCGIMVGSPGQTVECLAKDMIFMKELNPQMVGIGPFIPHRDTKFAAEKQGTVEDTVYLLGLIRLMLPNVLLPATTALATISEDGRQRGILAGANVVMPNLSPLNARKKYDLYDNKKSADGESAEGLSLLRKEIEQIGYEVVSERGDYKEDKDYV